MNFLNLPKNLKKNIKITAMSLAVLSSTAIMSGCGGTPPPAAIAAPAATSGVALPAGCLALTTAVGFSNPTAYMDDINFMSGTIPPTDAYFPGMTFGTVTDVAGGTPGPFKAPNARLTIVPDGSIAANALPVPAGTVVPVTPGTVSPPLGTAYGKGDTVNMTGSITVSSAKQSLVMNEIAAAYPSMNTMGSMPGTLIAPQVGAANYTQTICIVTSAISLHRSSWDLHSGMVYLYFYLPYQNSGMMGVPSAVANMANLTGAALFNLNKIVLRF